MCLRQTEASRRHLPHVIDERFVTNEVVMFLGVVPGLHLVSELHFAVVGLGLPCDDAQQRGLTGTVQTEHQQPLTSPQIEAHIVEHIGSAVRLS